MVYDLKVNFIIKVPSQEPLMSSKSRINVGGSWQTYFYVSLADKLIIMYQDYLQHYVSHHPQIYLGTIYIF